MKDKFTYDKEFTIEDDKKFKNIFIIMTNHGFINLMYPT